jgi:ElaB/YqjD/DUF883 family membrane-anchored ribosome-binding protein
MENPKEILREGNMNMQKLKQEVERRMKSNPWPYVAGTAMVSLFMGFLMGKNGKNRKM